MSQGIIFAFAFLFITFHLAVPLSTLPLLPEPDPATVQTQPLHPARSSPPATIPAFPEQQEASGCPLDFSEDLFHGIETACGSKPHHQPDPNSSSGQLHRNRCCPVLAAYLYSAYSKTALRASVTRAPQETASYDMPVLPDDSQTCVDTLVDALGNRGIELRNPNETCDVVYCYCGIRFHPFSCPEAFSVDSRGRIIGNGAVKKLERECSDGGKAGLAACSKCLNGLHLLNEDGGERSNKSERTSKMHNQDCELMGLTWLLNKNRSAYICTVSAVLRTLLSSKEDNVSAPKFCSVDSDGMPLAVDSSQINGHSSPPFLAVRFHHCFLALSLLCLSILFLTRF
ncbi:hypothetical protein CDL12_20798 [Handroanthus impetiginosus]|uniref:SPARK domain-containing protein n=1 Tax=Handroanthus impetiginosus TaxID=429701 RepID=A0A2G9GMX2_9LAMI|nr:hypothetical protein CDL12_20798 [Handroanthus impetiginosus]